MLTSELIRPRLRFSGSTLSVEMVDEQDVALQQTAQELIDLLRRHVGCALEKWEEALAAYEGARVDYVVVRGLAKVLADAATFTPLTTPFAPATLRERLFVHGPVFETPQLFHPQARYEVVQGVADELGISSEQVETTLFADRPATYLLTDAGPEWTPAGLLARYNLELARGVLYWASHIRIEAASNYKDLWKYIKFFKLMFWAEPKREGGYRIDLDGPISPFVSSTLRYGRQMAAFLPALLLCEQWRLLALDKNTGKIVWDKLGYEARPRTKRHPKGSHCSSSPATDGRFIVAIFGSEGLFCFDMEGQLLWKKDLGPLDAGLPLK